MKKNEKKSVVNVGEFFVGCNAVLFEDQYYLFYI